VKLDRKQIVQLAVLGVIVVAFVGYLSFRVIVPKERAASQSLNRKAAVKAVEPREETQAGPEATVTPQPQAWGVFPDLASVPARRDPFIAQKLPGGEIAGSTVRPPKYVPTALNALKNAMAKVPPIDIKPLNPFGKQNVSRTQAVQPPQDEPEEEITLTGVVRGDSNVVIVRVGKTGRHVVREGQSIDGRYRVVSVSGDGAVLAYKNRHIPVKLGGVKNAK